MLFWLGAPMILVHSDLILANTLVSANIRSEYKMKALILMPVPVLLDQIFNQMGLQAAELKTLPWFQLAAAASLVVKDPLPVQPNH